MSMKTVANAKKCRSCDQMLARREFRSRMFRGVPGLASVCRVCEKRERQQGWRKDYIKPRVEIDPRPCKRCEQLFEPQSRFNLYCSRCHEYFDRWSRHIEYRIRR